MSTSLHTAHGLGYYDSNDIWSLLGDYNTLILGLEEIIVNLETADADSNAEVADLKDRVQVLRDTVDNFKVTMQENTTTIDNIRTSFNTLKTTVDGYSNRIAGAEQSASELSNITTELSTNLSTLTDSVSSNATSIGNLSNSLNALTSTNSAQHSALNDVILSAKTTAENTSKALVTHSKSSDHDNRYYTKAVVDGLFNALFYSCNLEVQYGLPAKTGETYKYSETKLRGTFGLPSNYRLIGVIGVNSGNGWVIPQEMDVTADGSLQVKLFNTATAKKEASGYVKLLFAPYPRTVKNGFVIPD